MPNTPCLTAHRRAVYFYVIASNWIPTWALVRSPLAA